jgi:hypothetical protein
MLTTTSPEFTDWKRDLVDFGFKEEHVNESLISKLTAYGIEPLKFNDDQFRGYFYGDSEGQAGIEAVKEWVELGSWQEFIEDHIDWYAAWKTLESKARLALVRVSESDWVLVAK